MKVAAAGLMCLVAVAGSCKDEPASRGGSATGSAVSTTGIPAVEPPRLSFAEAQTVLDREAVVDQEPALHIGASAPALVTDAWLLGEPVALERGTVYVVENWATWCKPCIEQMPHLSELADKHRAAGLTVVAINVEEDNDDGVRTFVDSHRDSMRYSVGVDKGGRMKATWIDAAGLPGLPASFVVDRDGRIAWHGHPEALGRVVDRVMARRWDYKVERERARRERLAVPYSKRVVALLADDPDRAYRLIDALLVAVLFDQPEYLNGLAYHVFAAPDVKRRDLDAAYRAGALACERQAWSKPGPIEVLSKIREQQGQLDQAIALQERAVAASGGASRFAGRLATLRSGGGDVGQASEPRQR